MTLQRASELPYEDFIRSNCQYYLGVTKSSIRLITQLGQDGTWHGHVLKTAKDGRRKGVAVLTAEGANPREVLRKLHEESAREVDTHVAEYGIAHQRQGWLDGDSDYEDDDEDKDDLRSEASESDEEEGYDVGKPARFARHAGFLTAGNMALLARSRADSHLSTAGASHLTLHGAGNDMVPARHRCGHQPMRHIVPPYNNGSQPPPLWHQQPGAMNNSATRQAHQAGTRTTLSPSIALTPSPASPYPSNLRGVQFVPSDSCPAWDTRPASTTPAPAATTPTSNVPKPVLINVNWVDRCAFSLVEALPLLRKPIVDAALQAAQGRSEGGPEPRLVGVLKRVRLGRCESDVKCRIDDLGPLVRQMADSGTAGEAMPSFDVEIRTGPPQ